MIGSKSIFESLKTQWLLKQEFPMSLILRLDAVMTDVRRNFQPFFQMRTSMLIEIHSSSRKSWKIAKYLARQKELCNTTRKCQKTKRPTNLLDREALVLLSFGV